MKSSLFSGFLMIFFIASFSLLNTACGVKGDPLPPLEEGETEKVEDTNVLKSKSAQKQKFRDLIRSKFSATQRDSEVGDKDSQKTKKKITIPDPAGGETETE